MTPKLQEKIREMSEAAKGRSNQSDPYWNYIVQKTRALGYIDGARGYNALVMPEVQKLVEALETAIGRFSHIEDWHRDYVTPDTFKDCNELAITPEQYLRDGKNECREILAAWREFKGE